jgi:hypothetical protein
MYLYASAFTYLHALGTHRNELVRGIEQSSLGERRIVIVCYQKEVEDLVKCRPLTTMSFVKIYLGLYAARHAFWPLQQSSNL